MDIRGLVLVNSGSESEGAQTPLAQLPLGLLEVAGSSPLQRMAERLQKYGISSVTAVAEVEQSTGGYGFALPSGVNCITASTDRFWRTAESAFNELIQNGAELVVLVRLGAYAEIDFEQLVQFHLDRQSRVSQMTHDNQALQIFCISASRRNDAASLLRSKLTRCRSECPQLPHHGYINPLADMRDLRQFAIDILTRQTDTCPAGKQIKPGVWVASGGKIEKGARIVAPAFIGAFARIRAGAVVTRCSSIEHHAQVDCGSVVENSTLLPYSCVGAGLDLAHSVVGMNHIANLHRDVTVEIMDPKLIAMTSETAGRRFISSAAEFFTYVPRMAWQGMFAAKPQQPDLNAALRQTSPALGNAAGYETPACDTEAAHKFPNMVVARRYGHQ